MATAALYLAAAFLGGLVAVLLRLPPLVGYLGAGFALGAAGVAEPAFLEPVAEVGVALLLFAIGLKLDVRSLLRPEVWLTTTVHLALSAAVAMGLLGLLAVLSAGRVAADGAGALALVGFALAFSSTVFVVKVLEDRSDATTLYGRIAVGVLVMQDVAAVVFLSAAGGRAPSPWALALVGLVPGAWLVHRVWDRVGHGELQALLGVVVALVPGYALFESVGVVGDVGALLMGVLLAPHPRAGDLSRALLSVKDLMLVAFFVQIGLHGVPTLADVGIALLLLVLLPVQAGLYAALLWLLRLRRRTAFLAGLVLANFSEFGIIVADVGASARLLPQRWVAVVALAVAFSFVVAAVVNRRGVELASRLSRLLPARDPARLHPDDRLVDVGFADAIVLGLGRIGSATYARLRAHGLRPLGVEHDPGRVQELAARGFDVVRADATDLEFWLRVRRAGSVRVAVLAMPFHKANLIALARLQAAGFEGLRHHGADAVFHLYGSAGSELADRAVEVLRRAPGSSDGEPA
jgi:predicted Kef-type K+ transport protein